MSDFFALVLGSILGVGLVVLSAALGWLIFLNPWVISIPVAMLVGPWIMWRLAKRSAARDLARYRAWEARNEKTSLD